MYFFLRENEIDVDESIATLLEIIEVISRL